VLVSSAAPTPGLGFRGASVIRGLALVFVISAALSLPGQATGGDPSLAQFLLDAGKKAVSKREYDDGVTKLQKALEEDPTAIEAHYWIGHAYDKKGDMANARVAYRAFRNACTRAIAGTGLAKDLARLLKTADSRLKVLAAGESELERASAEFVTKALAFAKANFVRDPQIAVKALRFVLQVDPEQQDAVRLLEKLGVAAGASAEPPSEDRGPFGDVRTWTDLIAQQYTSADGMTYERDMLVMDHPEGRMIGKREPFDSTTAYVYEIEFRLLKAHGEWYCGLVFAEAKRERAFLAFVGANDVTVIQDTAGKKDVLDNPAIPPVVPDQWCRLLVAVKKNRLEVFVNDKSYFAETFPDELPLAGGIGLYHQGCRCEARRWRFGRRE